MTAPPLPNKSLLELQREMQAYLLGENMHVTAAIVDAPPLCAADRLAIYRNAYQVRLIDSLHETYPVLHSLLGDEAWLELGQDYVAAHPSVFRSIRWYGRELPGFLAANAPYDSAPILAEMATLEWTLSEVFDAPDAAAVSRAAFAGVEPDQWGALTFEFHPSLRRLSLSWNTAAVWKALSADETPPTPQRAAFEATWLLWRQNLQNYFRSLNPAESVALDSALRGRNFGAICEDLNHLLPDEEIPAAAAGFLGAWADSGIIVSLKSAAPGSQ